MKDGLSVYLNKMLAEKEMSIHEVWRRCIQISGDLKISYTYIKQLVTGKKSRPHFDKLELISKALGVPYPDILQAAGYLDQIEKQESDILEMLKLRYAPLFDDEKDTKYLLEPYIREAVVDDKMRKFLEEYYALPAEKRGNFLDGILAMMKGFEK